VRATVRQTCTDHCSSCGQHFHGLGAFDAHLQRFGEGLNERGTRSYHLRHLEGTDAKLEAWTTEGVCEMSKPTEVGVTVWRRPLSEKERERLAQLSGRA
jgi:hypothetical protein